MRAAGPIIGNLRPAPLEWAFALLGLFLVVHYRWLMDDAFVYFRYVDNLLFVGVGPVYNAGEYVEGFSSPLHFLVLTALRALGLGWPAIVAAIGGLAFVASWLLFVRLNRELSPAGAQVLNLPLAFLVCNYGFDSFFTSGLETPWAQLLAPAVALYLLRPHSRGLIALLSLAPLARPELALAVALAALFVCWRDRAFPWLLFLGVAAANGAWLVFRVRTYADLLPNTFYLKDGVRFDQGWRYLMDTVATYPLLGLALVSLVLALVARRRFTANGGDSSSLRVPERLAMLVIASAVAAYVVRVGGSHVHYWYLAFPVSLAVCAVAGLAESVWGGGGRGFARALGPLAMGGVALSVFSRVPPQLSAHPFFGAAEHASVGFIDDADWHRRHPSLAPGLLAAATPAAMRRAGREIAASDYLTTREGTWCRKQYANARDRWVHGFGLTDALLARTEAGWLKPGHKTPLIPLAKDIARIERDAVAIGPGMYRRAVARGTAPSWVAANLETIEAIERKIYNRHRFFENLGIALRRVPQIEIPGAGGAAVEDASADAGA